jgi:hypothetical protein
MEATAMIEVPAPTRRRLRQHLTGASEELHLLHHEYTRAGAPMPPELRRAWRAIRAARQRMEALEGQG